jgi:hypothetical protein
VPICANLRIINGQLAILSVYDGRQRFFVEPNYRGYDGRQRLFVELDYAGSL